MGFIFPVKDKGKTHMAAMYAGTILTPGFVSDEGLAQYAKSVPHWTFPPPPRIGHIKDIVLDGNRLWAGVEIGSLQYSDDFGKTFTELPVDPDPRECDIHRILVHPARPNRIRPRAMKALTSR